MVLALALACVTELLASTGVLYSVVILSSVVRLDSR